VRLRTPLPALALLLVAALCGACRNTAEATPAGCGLVAPRHLSALVGDDVSARTTGSLKALVEDGKPTGCRTTSTADRRRYVDIEVQRHPDPYRLPQRSCNAGWVYAGTPDAYAPACQETTAKGSRTVLVAREGDYLLHVTIGRADRQWAGDPELALALSDEVAEHLG
jgi:hypothetical protein